MARRLGALVVWLEAALLALLAVLLLATVASAQPAVVPSQGGNTKNALSTSAAATAVSITLTPGAATRAHLYGATVRCSAGTASLSVTDGGTTVWSSDAAFVTTASKAVAWLPGYTGVVGSAVVVTLGSCGGTALGTLAVQADIF